jgi:hypothetical protein
MYIHSYQNKLSPVIIFSQSISIRDTQNNLIDMMPVWKLKRICRSLFKYMMGKVAPNVRRNRPGEKRRTQSVEVSPLQAITRSSVDERI